MAEFSGSSPLESFPFDQVNRKRERVSLVFSMISSHPEQTIPILVPTKEIFHAMVILEWTHKRTMEWTIHIQKTHCSIQEKLDMINTIRDVYYAKTEIIGRGKWKENYT